MQRSRNMRLIVSNMQSFAETVQSFAAVEKDSENSCIQNRIGQRTAPPMHVLITSDTLNGNWIYTRELVSGLITRGMRVTLVSVGEIPLAEQTAWMERLHGLVYHPTAFRLDWMQEGQQDFDDASAYLCSLVKETRPDVFHSNHLCYGALPVAIPRGVVAHGDRVTWGKAVHRPEPHTVPGLRSHNVTITP